MLFKIDEIDPTFRSGRHQHNLWQQKMYRDLLSKTYTQTHFCYHILRVLVLWNVSCILPKTQSKQIIIIIILQKNGKTYMEKFEIFFVNLDVCLSFQNVRMSLSSQKLLFPLFCLILVSIPQFHFCLKLYCGQCL